MRGKPAGKQRHNPSRDPVFQVSDVASATECTGLMPAQIQYDEQGEQLAGLQGIHRMDSRPEDKRKQPHSN